MEIHETQRYVDKLHVSIRFGPEKIEDSTYNPQSVAVRVASNVFTSIPVCHVWHNNKWSVIKLVGAEEFWMLRSM